VLCLPGKPPVLIWVLFTAHLRFLSSRHPRLQDCQLRWPVAAELRRAALSPEVSGLILDIKASAAAEVMAGLFAFPAGGLWGPRFRAEPQRPPNKFMGAASEKATRPAVTFAKNHCRGRFQEVVTPYLQPAPSMCRSVLRGLPLSASTSAASIGICRTGLATSWLLSRHPDYPSGCTGQSNHLGLV
jgi:hypothetical protein